MEEQDFSSIEQYYKKYYIPAIVTEYINKKRIDMRNIKLYESYTEEISEDNLASDRLKSPKGKETKEMANFFNKHYKMNIPLDGNWKNPEYIKAMQRFTTEHKISVWTCRKGDGYCSDEQAGEIVVRDKDARAKFNRILNNRLLKMIMNP